MTGTAVGAEMPDDDPVDNLRRLRRIADERAELDRREYAQVLQLREQRVSWEAIAAALGVSRQAVHKRFRRRLAPNAP